MTGEEEEKFLSLVPIGDDASCWEWMGGKSRKGYGRISLGGRTQVASRIAYTVWVGEIPNGMLVCHTCDNPPCCNPNHLFLGTYQDNVDDMIRKGRAMYHRGPRGPLANTTNTARGERQGHSKLTTSDIVKIRKLRADGMFLSDIAKQFGVCRTAIGAILLGRNWKHVR